MTKVYLKPLENGMTKIHFKQPDMEEPSAIAQHFTSEAEAREYLKSLEERGISTKEVEALDDIRGSQ